MSTNDTSPVLLILGCRKYLESLKLAVKRFASPLFHVVGIIGGSEIESFDESVLHLPVSDSYDNLPQKIYEALRWTYTQYPNAIGVFKTDEDIVIHSQSEFEKTVMEHHTRPYWGFFTEMAKSRLIPTGRINARFDDKTPGKTYPTAYYCWGHGYWLSRSSVSLLLKHKEDYYSQYLEDMCTGSILNKYKIVPTAIHVPYTECVREDLLKGIITKNTVI